MKTLIAVLDKKGENATGAVARAFKTLPSEYSEGFGVTTPATCLIEGNAEALSNQHLKSAVAVGYTFTKTLPQYTPQTVKLENAAFVFTGRIYSLTQSAAAIAQATATKLEQNRDKAIAEFFSEVEGDYAFILMETNRITAGRDPIGVKPFYYGENMNIAALASNRKVLWQLGIEETQSFPPGHSAVVNREGFEFKPVKTLVYTKPQAINMQAAAETLQKLLENSVRERVLGLKEVAVAFSGGLDSSVVAFLAKKCQVNVRLVHVSLRNQAETEEARKAAEELHLPILVSLFEEEDVEGAAAKVVELIEEPDPVKTAIGVPFYWTAAKTAEAGFRVLLAGQGADELFGGYRRYINDYLLHEKEEARRNMFNDVARLHESNIERDVKICSFFDVELRLPFASYALADFALSLPLELKIEKKADSLRKLVLRKAAENMGLPAALISKPKKAIQYATGINNTLKKIAKRQNITVNAYVKKLFLRSR